MSKEKPILNSDDHWDLVRKKTKAIAEQLANASPADFEETGLLSGGENSLTSTDAKAFPDEVEEYKPEERKRTACAQEKRLNSKQVGWAVMPNIFVIKQNRWVLLPVRPDPTYVLHSASS